MTATVRLQLSRRNGFNLQALSMATNGLPAVSVARPGMWGNPFIVDPDYPANYAFAARWLRGRIAVPTIEDAVACYRDMLTAGKNAAALRAALPQLRGKNLACWCKPGAPCHADVLLDLANRPSCEEAT